LNIIYSFYTESILIFFSNKLTEWQFITKLKENGFIPNFFVVGPMKKENPVTQK